MSKDEAPAISAQDLTREYAPGRGVSGVTLRVERGECVALLGRNGSGKSTLTRLVLGLEKAASGTLSVLGQEVSGRKGLPLERIGAVTDTDTHWDKLSGRANAWFFARSRGIPGNRVRKILDDLFERADLSQQADEPVSGYSFGMRRKLTLVEALCHDPELLVLDEPTIGLDAQFLLFLSQLVRERTERGYTTWISGNDTEWAACVATSAAFMESGRVAAAGPVSDFLAGVSRRQEILVDLEAPVPVAEPSGDGICSFSQNGSRITALSDDNPAVIPRFLSWIHSQGGRLRSLEVHRSTLRDAYFLKTGRTLEE